MAWPRGHLHVKSRCHLWVRRRVNGAALNPGAWAVHGWHAAAAGWPSRDRLGFGCYFEDSASAFEDSCCMATAAPPTASSTSTAAWLVQKLSDSPTFGMVTAPPVDFSRRDANSQCMLQRQLGNVGYMPGSGIVYLLQCALVACSSQWPGSIAGWLYSLVCTVLHSFTCRDCPRHGNHAPLEPCRFSRFSFFPYRSIHIKQIFENSNNFIKQIAIFKTM